MGKVLTSYLAFVSFRQNFRPWRFDCVSRRDRTPLEDPFQLQMVGVFMLDCRKTALLEVCWAQNSILIYRLIEVWAVSLHKSDPQSPSFLVFRKLVHAYTRSARIISTSGTIRCASNTSSTSSLLFLLLRHISMLVWVHNTTSQQYHVTFLAARCRGHTLEPKARISNAKKMTPETFWPHLKIGDVF